jgi:RNA-directed DNA polymerase
MQERKAPRGQREQDPASEAWNKLPWRKLEKHCFRIQKRIYRASQRGNTRAVHKLQKLLMKSEAARLLAVRRVTQENQGKKTAGIDGVKGVSISKRENCMLSKTGDRADALIWLHKWIEEKGFEVQKDLSSRDLLS